MTINTKFLLLLLLISLFSFSSEDDFLFYSISDNLLHSYNVDIFSVNEDTLLEFTIEPKNFQKSKKSIFIYFDAYSQNSQKIANHKIWSGALIDEETSENVYSNLDLTVFLFRQQNNGEKDHDQFSIRISPLKSGTPVKIRIETSDEGVVFNTGERVNRIYGVTFKYGYNDPFYIVSSHNLENNHKAILYIEQESGLFPVDLINSPSETHILPKQEENDKHFEPLLGHFSKLDTNFEIIHVNKGEPGFSNYYIVVENSSDKMYIEEKNVKQLIHIKANEKFDIYSPNYENEKVNVKIEKIMGEKILAKSDEKEYELNDILKSQYISINKSSGRIHFEINSETDSIISISFTNENLYKISEMENGGKIYPNTKFLLLKFPKFDHEDEDFSSISLSFKPTNPSLDFKILSLMGKELEDYLNFVPDIRYSCNYVYNQYQMVQTKSEESTSYAYSLKIENPYDMFNTSNFDSYYIALIVTSDSADQGINFSYKLTLKNYDIMHKVKPNSFIYLKNENDYLERFLMQKNFIKNQGFYLLVHQCGYDSERNNNLVMLNYFEEKTIWSEKLKTEYQVFKLTNNYENMDFQIGNFDIPNIYKDYIMTYYQVSLKQDFYLGPSEQRINSKIKFLKSRVFNFELDGNRLSWDTYLTDDSDPSGIYITDKEYLICTIEDTEENRKYATNECFIEDMLSKEKIQCVTETKEYTDLNEGQKNYLISVFEIVNLPVKVRYSIGIFKYGTNNEKKKDETEPVKNIGKYQQLVQGGTITAKAYERNFLYFDLTNFAEEEEGVINVGTIELKDMYYFSKKFNVLVLATNLALSENLFDSVLTNGATSLQGETYKVEFGYDFEFEYSEILFNRKKLNYEKFILLMTMNDPEQNVKFNGVGKILQMNIDSDLMLSKFINFDKLGIPIYVHIKVTEENFQANKKGLFIYTDNIENGFGDHQVYSGTPLDHSFSFNTDGNTFINYPLSVFQFEANNMDYAITPSATIVFYPKKIGVSVKINVQTTDEGVVIYSEKRINRVFQTIFSKGYDEPFYVVCTYPEISDAVLFVEQEIGKFQIDMISSISDSHLLPLPSDKSFIPDQNHFSRLNTYFEILHISAIFPGKALFHYILNLNSIINFNENSVEKIHIRKGVPFYVNTPYSSEDNQKINIKVKNVMTIGPPECFLNIAGEEKNITLPLGEEKYLQTVIEKEDSKKLLTFYAEEDTILIITIVMKDNLYTEITGTSEGLYDKYILYKFPKNNNYAAVQIKVEPEYYDEDIGFEIYAVTGIEKNENYIPDPRQSTNYLSFSTSGNRKNYFAMANPYDLFQVKDDEFYYFSLVVTNFEYIPTYRIGIYFSNKRPVEKVLSQNEFYQFKYMDNEEKIQFETQKPNPEGLIILAHICGFREELALQNLLFLDYDQISITRKYLNEEYNFLTIGNTYNGMNIHIETNRENDDFNNIIVSYSYEPDIINMGTEEKYLKKLQSLQSEKYTFNFDFSSSTLNWVCNNCNNDDSEVTTSKINYLVCFLEDNLKNQVYLTNQCYIHDKKESGEINCVYLTDEKNSIQINENQLSKIVVIYKESFNPLLIRTFVGYYRYKDDNSSGGTSSIGEFTELTIGQKLSISNGKFYLKLRNDEIENGNSGIIEIENEFDNENIKAGFDKISNSINQNSLETILKEGNNVVILKNEKTSQLIFTRNSKNEFDYYLVLDFNFEQRKNIYISGPIIQFLLLDNNMQSSVLHCYQENGPIYASVKIDPNNIYSGSNTKKSVFIYIDDISKANHEIFLNMSSESQKKINHPLTTFLFRKSDFEPNPKIYIRIIPTKSDTSVKIQVQSSDEGVVIYDKERINGSFDVSFSFSRKEPFYIVNSFTDYSDEYFLYIKQKTGLFSISVINSPSQTHITPDEKNDKVFFPKEGHYSKIGGYFSIIHVDVKNFGLATFYFILNSKDIKILPNSLNNLIVEYGNDNYFNLPKINSGSTVYGIKAECLMCNNTVTVKYSNGEIKLDENGNKNFQGKVDFGSDQKFSLHSSGGSNIISLTVITTNNLFKILDKSTKNLNSEYILVKFPKENYETIMLGFKLEEENKKIRVYSSSGISLDENENYIPDPRYAFNLESGLEEIVGKTETYSMNPYDFLNISKNEFYYKSMFISPLSEDEKIPNYSIEIKTIKSDESKNNLLISSKNNEITYLKLEEKMKQILVEKKEPKAKSLKIYVHSCRFDSKQKEPNKIAVSYYSSELVWGREIKREYQIFSLSNDFSNVNILIEPYKSVEKRDFNDFIISYYLFNENEAELPNEEKYNEKIDKIRGEKYLIFLKNKKLKWEFDHGDIDKGNDGTEIKVNKRNYLVCLLEKNNEIKENKKLITNECYIENLMKNKQISCQRFSENEYDISDLEDDKIVVIFQEVEIPIKMRFYLGMFDKETNITKSQVSYIFLTIIALLVVILIAIIVTIIIVIKSNKNVEISKPANNISMSEKKTEENDENALNNKESNLI